MIVQGDFNSDRRPDYTCVRAGEEFNASALSHYLTSPDDFPGGYTGAEKFREVSF
ncbi:MAG: hypothetical protein ABIO91_08245 [Pyrinomonadaceae bacterium]